MHPSSRKRLSSTHIDRYAYLSTVLCLVVGLTTSGIVEAQSDCAPLPPPVGTILEVHPAEASQLRSIVLGAGPDTTILLHDGLYDMSGGDSNSRLVFNTPGVTLRSVSGNREAVVLDGGYATDELISIRSSNVTIADLTLKRAYNHPVHMSGSPGDPIAGNILHNIHIIDPGQQAIKVNAVEDGYVDYGVIRCSRIELTDTGRAQVRDNCYTGGIDVHKAWGWVVHDNWIEGFWCDNGLSEHGIHFWSTSRDTLVEENVIVDCARGIGYGLREVSQTREYPDDPYPDIGYIGHIDGVIRNNFIAASDEGLFASGAGFDSGVALEQAHGTAVYHNTVASTATPRSSSIEWRFENTLADIANNLTTDRLQARNGGVATLAGNLSFVPTSWFLDVPAADLHLSQAGAPAIDAGVVLPPGVTDRDIDGETRVAPPDVGADEVFEVLFSDGFESGTTDGWSMVAN